ncbi:MAG: hypothetical protein HYV09_32190 [Deltaproteobacteria bacterium]|nr:hypothetical protein [Deltaproteobacteria bacterium]
MTKIAALLTVALTAACATSDRTPTARGGGPPAQLPVDDAAVEYANEACAREERCDRVGKRKQLSSESSCESSFAHVAMQGLAVCDSRRVTASLLADCLQSIRSSSCGTDVQAACSYVELCAP